ncbi:MAG: three-Cys-motif partner protein TcmP [Bacilli bacterium]|jgi:three-Cys-motif partner protein|nr:three-Cys-motif partner protein TcmP [Bacilli bacterium]
MSKKNDDFFVAKKPWSFYKDKLLGCYLVPYFQKIVCSGRPLFYVDCFAGKGKFDDGNPGSPLIAMECLNKAKSLSKRSYITTTNVFIESEYYDDLKENLADGNYSRCAVIAGKFEDNIEKILKESENHNLFVYFDPYGIKALNMKTFLAMGNRKNSNRCSAELLINFNSFGLYRNCCKVLDYTEKETELTGLEEYDPTNVGTKEGINAIFGTDRWEGIIEARKANEFTSFEAEKRLTDLFCNQLRGKYGEFKYVLSMPIRATNDTQPKYRMIHATNHEEGCIIMAENMFNRSQESQDERNHGQTCLFERGVEDDPVNMEQIEKQLLEMIPYESTHFNNILIDFYQKYGVVISKKTLTNFLAKYKKSNLTEELRYPPRTSTGRESTFYSEKQHEQTLLIRRIENGSDN